MIPLFENLKNTDRPKGLSLTQREAEILKYIEEHTAQAVHMSLSGLSRSLYTSSASVVRLCQKLGFSGYNEFKYEVRRQLEQQSQGSPSPQSLVRRSLAVFKDNLEMMDPSAAESMTEWILSPRTMYIFGSGLSCAPAGYLHSVLNTLDRPCIFIEWRHLLDGITRGLQKGTVLLIITARGDAERYLSILENAKARGAVILLITCRRDSPLIPLCDVSLTTNDPSETVQELDINSRMGILTAVQLLIELVIDKKGLASGQRSKT